MPHKWTKEELVERICKSLHPTYYDLEKRITGIGADVEVGATSQYIPFRLRDRGQSNFAAVRPRDSLSSGCFYLTLCPTVDVASVPGVTPWYGHTLSGKLTVEIRVDTRTNRKSLEKLVRQSYETVR
jgi:predicted transport protein